MDISGSGHRSLHPWNDTTTDHVIKYSRRQAKLIKCEFGLDEPTEAMWKELKRRTESTFPNFKLELHIVENTVFQWEIVRNLPVTKIIKKPRKSKSTESESFELESVVSSHTKSKKSVGTELNPEDCSLSKEAPQNLSGNGNPELTFHEIHSLDDRFNSLFSNISLASLSNLSEPGMEPSTLEFDPDKLGDCSTLENNPDKMGDCLNFEDDQDKLGHCSTLEDDPDKLGHYPELEHNPDKRGDCSTIQKNLDIFGDCSTMEDDQDKLGHCSTLEDDLNKLDDSTVFRELIFKNSAGTTRVQEKDLSESSLYFTCYPDSSGSNVNAISINGSDNLIETDTSQLDQPERQIELLGIPSSELICSVSNNSKKPENILSVNNIANEESSDSKSLLYPEVVLEENVDDQPEVETGQLSNLYCDKKKVLRRSFKPSKRSLNCYHLFLKEKYKQVEAENPGLGRPNINRKVSLLWKNMSAEEQKKYYDLANKNREQMTCARPKLQSPIRKNFSNDVHKSLSNVETDGRVIKSAFWYFCRQKRASFRTLFGFMSENQLSREIKAHWEKLSAQEKQVFQEKVRKKIGSQNILKQEGLSKIASTVDKEMFGCRFCDKSYKYERLLNNHIRLHLGETPYQCHLCGLSFYSPIVRGTHIYRHHPKNAKAIQDQNVKSKATNAVEIIPFAANSLKSFKNQQLREETLIKHSEKEKPLKENISLRKLISQTFANTKVVIEKHLLENCLDGRNISDQADPVYPDPDCAEPVYPNPDCSKQVVNYNTDNAQPLNLDLEVTQSNETNTDAGVSVCDFTNDDFEQQPETGKEDPTLNSHLFNFKKLTTTTSRGQIKTSSILSSNSRSSDVSEATESATNPSNQSFFEKLPDQEAFAIYRNRHGGVRFYKMIDNAIALKQINAAPREKHLTALHNNVAPREKHVASNVDVSRMESYSSNTTILSAVHPAKRFRLNHSYEFTKNRSTDKHLNDNRDSIQAQPDKSAIRTRTSRSVSQLDNNSTVNQTEDQSSTSSGQINQAVATCNMGSGNQMKVSSTLPTTNARPVPNPHCTRLEQQNLNMPLQSLQSNQAGNKSFEIEDELGFKETEENLGETSSKKLKLPEEGRELVNQVVSASSMSVEQVAQFVGSIPGCSQISGIFRKEQIDGFAFLLLKKRDLVTRLGIKFGPAIKIYTEATALRNASK